MRTRNRHLFATILLIAAISAQAQDPNKDQGKDFHWKGKLAAENIIMIKNVNGDINAEPATGDEAEVTAEKAVRKPTASRSNWCNFPMA